MSKMFMDALEKHISQLEGRSSTNETVTREAQRAQIEALLATAKDGRFRRSLNNALRKLDQSAPKAEATGPDILPQLRELHALLDNHPEYRKKRKRREAAPVAKAAKAVRGTERADTPALKLNKAFMGR